MRLQYAVFIAPGSGATESGPVENMLDANVVCLMAESESGTPDLTVEILTSADPDSGTWLPGTVLDMEMTEQDGVTENGFYFIPMGGVRYLRITSANSDEGLTVTGAFLQSPTLDYSAAFKDDGIIDTLTRITENGYIEWTTGDVYLGSVIGTDADGNLVQSYDDGFEYIPAELSIDDGNLSASVN